MLGRLNQLPQRTRPPRPEPGCPAAPTQPAGRGALPSTHQVKRFALDPEQQAGRARRVRLPAARSPRRGGLIGAPRGLRRPEPLEVPGPGRREAALVRPVGLGTGNGSALSLSPASLSHLCWADSFCGKSLTVKGPGARRSVSR